MVLFSTILMFVGTFLAACAAVAIAWLVVERKRRARETSASGSEAPRVEGEESPTIFKEETLSTISVWDALLARFDFVQILSTRLAESGLRWSVGRLTLMMLLAGSVVLWMTLGVAWLNETVALGLSLLAALLPYLYVLRLRRKRFAKLEEQFPDALESLARSLRAGNSLSAGLEMMASENTPPLSVEIRNTCDEWKLGVSWDKALDNLAGRVPLLSIRLFVAAVALQSRTGGRLNETLTRLAETMREQAALQGEVRAIAAQGKLTGVVLTAIPIFIAAMMAYVNPPYLPLLWHHPWGKNLVVAAVLCLVAAHFVIRKIVDVKL